MQDDKIKYGLLMYVSWSYRLFVNIFSSSQHNKLKAVFLLNLTFISVILLKVVS